MGGRRRRRRGTTKDASGGGSRKRDLFVLFLFLPLRASPRRGRDASLERRFLRFAMGDFFFPKRKRKR